MLWMTYERGRPPHPELLTPAEQRVMDELREGRPNAEIAVRLGVSVNTVRYHVSNMLGKLELPNRAALRSWDGKRRREWGWASMWGFRFGSRFSAAGKLTLAVGVATAVAGLLVVGSGRVTLPLMMEEAPVAVTSEVVEPQDVGAEVGARSLDLGIYWCVASVVSSGTDARGDGAEPSRRVDRPVVRIDGPHVVVRTGDLVVLGDVVKCPPVATMGQ